MDTEGKGGNLKLLTSTAKPLTNRPEYDNQPSFINDSELIFSAADDKGNNDLILYSFRTSRFTNLTQTPDRSEFSPSMTECGSYFSAIVVERQNKLCALTLAEPNMSIRKGNNNFFIFLEFKLFSYS